MPFSPALPLSIASALCPALALSIASALLPACGEKVPKADEGLIHDGAGANKAHAARAQCRRLFGQHANGRRIHVPDADRHAVLLGGMRQRRELLADLGLALHVVEENVA